MKNKSNILIIEPSIIIFEGISKILESLDNDVSITKSDSLIDALNIQINKEFDIILINPVLFEGNKFHSFFSHFNSTKIIGLVTTFLSREICTQFTDFIYINDSEEIIKNAITKYLTIKDTGANTIDNSLSEREKEVLKLLVSGKMNKEIAEELFISIHTVVTHRKNISTKLGVKSAAAMAIYAVANNIIDLKDSLKSIK